MRAHVDRRFSLGDRPSGSFSNQHQAAAAPGGEIGLGCGKLLIWRRLARDGSPAVVQSPGPGSPEPPRSKPSTRGSELTL